MRNPFSKTYTVICPDGPREVYKNVDDVFPLQLKTSKAASGASIKVLNDLQGKLEFKNEEKVAAVLVGIDKVNQSMQVQFRAAYAVFQAAPCTALPYLKDAIAKTIVEEQKLRAVESIMNHLSSIIERGPKSAPLEPAVVNIIQAQLNKAMDALVPEQNRLMVEKMKQVTDNTEQWRRDD